MHSSTAKEDRQRCPRLTPRRQARPSMVKRRVHAVHVGQPKARRTYSTRRQLPFACWSGPSHRRTHPPVQQPPETAAPASSSRGSLLSLLQSSGRFPCLLLAQIISLARLAASSRDVVLSFPLRSRLRPLPLASTRLHALRRGGPLRPRGHRPRARIMLFPPTHHSAETVPDAHTWLTAGYNHTKLALTHAIVRFTIKLRHRQTLTKLQER